MNSFLWITIKVLQIWLVWVIFQLLITSKSKVKFRILSDEIHFKGYGGEHCCMRRSWLERKTVASACGWNGNYLETGEARDERSIDSFGFTKKQTNKKKGLAVACCCPHHDVSDSSKGSGFSHSAIISFKGKMPFRKKSVKTSPRQVESCPPPKIPRSEAFRASRSWPSQPVKGH